MDDAVLVRRAVFLAMIVIGALLYAHGRRLRALRIEDVIPDLDDGEHPSPVAVEPHPAGGPYHVWVRIRTPSGVWSAWFERADASPRCNFDVAYASGYLETCRHTHRGEPSEFVILPPGVRPDTTCDADYGWLWTDLGDPGA